jgi:hypothetical protein
MDIIKITQIKTGTSLIRNKSLGCSCTILSLPGSGVIYKNVVSDWTLDLLGSRTSNNS